MKTFFSSYSPLFEQLGETVPVTLYPNRNALPKIFIFKNSAYERKLG